MENRFLDFSNDELYVLHRMAIECGFTIMMEQDHDGKDKYGEIERDTYNKLSAEIEEAYCESLNK